MFGQLFLYLFGRLVIDHPLADRVRAHRNRTVRFVLHNASVFRFNRDVLACYTAFPGHINTEILVFNVHIAGVVDDLSVNADIAGKQRISLSGRITDGNKGQGAVRFFRMDIRGARKAAVLLCVAVYTAVIQVNIAAFFYDNGVVHLKVKLAAAVNSDFRIPFCRQRSGNRKLWRIDPDIASGHLHIRQIDPRYFPIFIYDVVNIAVRIRLRNGKTGSDHFLHQTVHIRCIVVVILSAQRILHILL